MSRLAGSHKKRDYRCWAVAPQLEHGASFGVLGARSLSALLTALLAAFTQALEREAFDVHHQLEDPSLSGPSLEDDPALHSLASSPSEKHDEIRRRLQQHAQTEPKRALILFCSHVGQHKFAGNVIVRPSSSSSSFLFEALLPSQSPRG